MDPKYHFESLTKELESLKDRRALLIWGMQDWCFNSVCLDRFAELFPKHEIHRFEDVGHYVVEEAHERIIPLMRAFLAGESRSDVQSDSKLVWARSGAQASPRRVDLRHRLFELQCGW